MLYSDIPKVLFSSIKKDDPYRDSKLFQIERWCYANWDLHRRGGKKRHDFLVEVLSSDDCWKKVDNLHKVKLDRQAVGKKLIQQGSPFKSMSYRIACRYCLEEDIISLFEERKIELLDEGDSKFLEYDYLIGCLDSDLLTTFWSHFISGYIDKLDQKLNGRHPYEYGLDCAVILKQAQAVEFFWNKIESLPKSELSAEQKDKVFMDTAVRTAGGRYNINCPEMFEFFFSKMCDSRYHELLGRDLFENSYYGSLSALREARSFDQYQKLFDLFNPNDITDYEYRTWLLCIEISDYSKHYACAGMKLMMYMWARDGFDDHRAYVIRKDLSDLGVQGTLLIPLVNKNYMEPVWAILDKATPEQIKEFMNSNQAKNICSTLRERNDGSLEKFLSYNDRSIEGGDINTGLTNVKSNQVGYQLGME